MTSLRFLPTRLLLIALLAAIISACSAKRNTAASRRYQAFITRYNIQYNGDTHYSETLDEMEKKYEDDFTQLLYTHPAEARADEKATQPTGDFTRSIEKAQKAIQLRSIKAKPAPKPGKKSDPAYKAWMKREEYNPYLHNSWMLMGRSQFMNGDFTGAAATFFYISRHFSWLPQTVTEARLWQARSYCAMDWLFDAEMILTRIKEDQLTSKTLRSLYNSTYADFQIRSRHYAEALPYLREAVKLASGAQKTRLTFLLGQVATLAGQNAEAYTAFGKVSGSVSTDYRTRFNARIKQSEVFDGPDIESEVNALRRMTRYDRNREYADQIYYAIANLYLSNADTLKAIENYRLAAEKSTRDGIDKAISQTRLGGLYYELGRYDEAQPCYAEAIPKLPESYPDYRKLKRRSDILDELSVYSHNVTLQDSLLRLSYMTPDEQLEIINRIIDELNQKEKEEAEAAAREEFMNSQAANGSQLNASNAPTTYTMNSSDSWYFYNPSTVSAGKTEFQRRWGSRKLEDDWRRRNKAAFSFDDFATTSDDEESDSSDDTIPEEAPDPVDEEKTKRESDPHFPEYYLKMIPSDSTSRALSHDLIREGLYDMGVILKDKMEDFPAAREQFNTLNTRYPDNTYRLDAYFNMYLMYARENDIAGMERMRSLILSDFPDSKEGIALRDPAYIDNLRLMESQQNELYDRALQAYFENRNPDVHAAYDDISERFPMSKLMPRFMFLHALACVTDHRTDEFRSTLNQMLERYPDTDLSIYAAAWLGGLAKGRELQTGLGENLRGMLWDIHLSNDSTAFSGDPSQLEFDLNPDDAQILVLLYPTDRISTNALLFNIARHNFSTFAIMDFDLETMNYGQLGLLLIRGFENVAQINHYRSLMQQNPDLSIPAGVIPVVISEKNFNTMLSHGASFEQYFEFARDKTYRDTQESVLDPDIFGAAEPLESEDPSETNEPASAADLPADLEPTAGQEATIDSPDQFEPVRTEASEMQDTPPAVAPAEPAPAPAATSPTIPSTQQPTTEPKPAPKPAPTAPLLPAGSEGDDPLLDF